MQQSNGLHTTNELTCSNISDSNLRELLEELEFRFIEKKQDYEGTRWRNLEKLCHYTHKNLNWRVAPLLPQCFVLEMDSLHNVKYVVIEGFTHGAEMTISVAEYSKYIPAQISGPYVQVYKDKYICKGKSLKQQQKRIDLGALPCRAIRLAVSRGVHVNSNSIKLVGCASDQIQEKLGGEYFKLLVSNPQRIIYG